MLAATAFCSFGTFYLTAAFISHSSCCRASFPATNPPTLLWGFCLHRFGLIALALTLSALRTNVVFALVFGTLAAGFIIRQHSSRRGCPWPHKANFCVRTRHASVVRLYDRVNGFRLLHGLGADREQIVAAACLSDQAASSLDRCLRGEASVPAVSNWTACAPPPLTGGPSNPKNMGRPAPSPRDVREFREVLRQVVSRFGPSRKGRVWQPDAPSHSQPAARPIPPDQRRTGRPAAVVRQDVSEGRPPLGGAASSRPSLVIRAWTSPANDEAKGPGRLHLFQ